MSEREQAIELFAAGITMTRFLRFAGSRERLGQIRPGCLEALDALKIPHDDHQRIDTLIAERVQGLRALAYSKYLQTPHWQMVRACALELADYRCQVCNSAERPHVHHRSYEDLGDENPWDVVVLCATCHKLFHDHGRLRK